MNVGDLYEDHERGLWRYAKSLTGDSDRADDLVQDAFLRASRNRLLLTQMNGRQCRSWLYQTLRNAFLDELRSRRRWMAAVEMLVDLVDDDRNDPANLVTLDLLSLVSDRDREVLTMRYVQDMNSTEIGNAFGVPAGTIRSRLRLALTRLRRRVIADDVYFQAFGDKEVSS